MRKVVFEMSTDLNSESNKSLNFVCDFCVLETILAPLVFQLNLPLKYFFNLLSYSTIILRKRYNYRLTYIIMLYLTLMFL